MKDFHTLDDVKTLIENGNRKWGLLLFHHIKTYFDRGDSCVSIKNKLFSSHGIVVKERTISNLKNKHYNKTSTTTRELNGEENDDKTETETNGIHVPTEEEILEMLKRKREEDSNNSFKVI